MKRAIFVLAAIILSPLQVFGVVIEQQEWETRPGAPWDISGNNTLDCAPSGGSSPSGGCAWRFDYAAGTYTSSVGAGGAAYPLSSLNLQELYAGHWVKFMDDGGGFSWNPLAQKVDYLVNDYDGVNNHSHSFRVAENGVNINGENTSVPNLVYDTWYGNIGAFTPGKWYWWQIHFVQSNPAGATNGSLQVWINNNLVASVSGLVMDTTSLPLAYFYHEPVWGGGGGTIARNQHIWYDHTVLATTQAETNMPGGTSNTTPPPPPSGLRVQ